MPGAAARIRLDRLLVDRGLVESRERAARQIMAGEVVVEGRRVDKPGALVRPGVTVALEPGPRYVSRGGDKLDHALQHFGIDPGGRICLDVGASTGGFTDCLLQHGAARVYAVDVGHGQLDASLRADPRVIVLERCNARTLEPALVGERPTLAVVDVSFISLRLVLPAIVGVLADDGQVVALVKPQFEAGRAQVGKGGIVRDPRQHRAVLERVAGEAGVLGWPVVDVTPSPLRGAKGNREFFVRLVAGANPPVDLAARIAAATEAAA